MQHEHTDPSVGPLAGITVLELGGIGPGPFAGMMLADMGATVLRLVRNADWERRQPVLHRGRVGVVADLKSEAGVAAVRRIAGHCDVVIEGFRPGVAERLGLGPDELLADNPALVYGRMTGWGQDGPWAAAPGHDINYLSLTGALHAIGTEASGPVPPLNLAADFGGGGMVLAYGVACALLQSKVSGTGQVVDAAMVDGASVLMSMIYGMLHTGFWVDERESNLIDGAAPFYRVYECSDGRHMAVGCVEPQFYRAFVDTLGVGGEALFEAQLDRSRWVEQRERIAEIFAGRPREHWAALFEPTEACVTPVLSMSEAADHPHVAARGTFTREGGLLQPMPAPRFSRTSTRLPRRGVGDRAALVEALTGAGLTESDIDELVSAGAITPADEVVG